jgi:hypothetical protein
LQLDATPPQVATAATAYLPPPRRKVSLEAPPSGRLAPSSSCKAMIRTPVGFEGCHLAQEDAEPRPGHRPLIRRDHLAVCIDQAVLEEMRPVGAIRVSPVFALALDHLTPCFRGGRWEAAKLRFREFKEFKARSEDHRTQSSQNFLNCSEESSGCSVPCA